MDEGCEQRIQISEGGQKDAAPATGLDFINRQLFCNGPADIR
jgi:hypothetical protein